MKRSMKKETTMVGKKQVDSQKGSRRLKDEFVKNSVSTYRDIKDWYYGDKYKFKESLMHFSLNQRIDEDDCERLCGDGSLTTNRFEWTNATNRESPVVLSPINKLNLRAMENGAMTNAKSLRTKSSTFKSSKYDLFKNPGCPTKLVLKKASKNIRLGYKKIIRRDSLYDELYTDNEFLCCKEYKRYVEDLVSSHREETCKDVHKGRLEYLCEVACNEYYSKKKPEDFMCEEKTNCPLKYCKDTFCSQCNLCVVNSSSKDPSGSPK